MKRGNWTLWIALSAALAAGCDESTPQTTDDATATDATQDDATATDASPDATTDDATQSDATSDDATDDATATDATQDDATRDAVEDVDPGVAPTVSMVTTDRHAVSHRALTLTAAGDDADGDALTYAWTQTEGPVTLTLPDEDSDTLTVRPWAAGVYTFSVTTNDGTFDSEDAATVQITVWSVSFANHAAMVTPEGKLWTWGEYSSGQLGNGNTQPIADFHEVPVPSNATGSRWVSVAAGSATTFGILDDGSVWGWGENSAGETGTNSPDSVITTPTPVCTTGHSGDATCTTAEQLTDVRHISAEETFAVALLADGTLRSWGGNEYGELGNGESEAPASLATVVCAPGTTGCGQGDGALTGVAQIATYSESDIQLGMALLESGELVTWGHEEYGLLGRGPDAWFSPTPDYVCADATCTEHLTGLIDATYDYYHALVTFEDGTIATWGYDEQNYGHLGYADDPDVADDALYPKRLTDTGWTQGVAGYGTSLGLKDGKPFSWGFDGNPALDENGADRTENAKHIDPWPFCAEGVPAPCTEETQHLTGISALIPSGEGLLFMLTLDGRWLAQGTYTSELYAAGDYFVATPRPVTSPASGLSSDGWVDVDSGISHTVGLDADGNVYVWGGGLLRQGRPDTDSSAIPLPVCMDDACTTFLTGVTQIAAGAYYTLALLDSGQVVAWGRDIFGTLGVGCTPGSNFQCPEVPLPTPVCNVGCTGPLTNITAIAANPIQALSLAVNTSGDVLTWGRSRNGLLGDNTTQDRAQTSPVHVCDPDTTTACSDGNGELTRVTHISTGNSGTLAVLRSGQLVGWPTGSLTSHSTSFIRPRYACLSGSEGTCNPTDGGVVSNVVRTATRDRAHFAVLNDGSLLSWGDDFALSLGNGDAGSRAGADAVCAIGTATCDMSSGGLAGAIDVTTASIGHYALALLDSGQLVAWGGFGTNNFYGLGTLQSGLSSPAPVCAPGATDCTAEPMRDVTLVHAGTTQTFAITSSGQLYGWGKNDAGRLGVAVVDFSSAAPINLPPTRP